MTNFEFFKDKCQNTEVFAYHEMVDLRVNEMNNLTI